jgi:hypothetical protein
MPKPPMTPDDIDALSKAWNESKAATDAVLAKFREGAAKDEIDDAIRKMYATRLEARSRSSMINSSKVKLNDPKARNFRINCWIQPKLAGNTICIK